MGNEYNIETMTDFLALTSEQRKKCVVDMLVWADYWDEMSDAMSAMAIIAPSFIWIDDDRIGEISGISFNDITSGDELARLSIARKEPK